MNDKEYTYGEILMLALEEYQEDIAVNDDFSPAAEYGAKKVLLSFIEKVRLLANKSPKHCNCSENCVHSDGEAASFHLADAFDSLASVIELEKE